MIFTANKFATNPCGIIKDNASPRQIKAAALGRALQPVKY